MAIEDLTRHYNDLLRADGCAARIYLRGMRLQLQATLPPLPESQKQYPHQQRITLKLAAIPENLEIADRKARILSRAIAEGTFDWSDWRSAPKPKSRTCAEWIETYRSDFFDRRAATPQSLSTWEDHYKYLKKLPESQTLTQKLIKETLLAIAPDTRSRQKAARVLGRLSEVAGISIDLSSYAGNYGLKDLDPRSLPSDEEILEWRDKIPAPEWQLVYELIAAYGIRPHEIAYLQLEAPRLTVLDGKTGPRTVYPCPSWWAEVWDLNSLALLPALSGKDNNAIGQRVTHAFKRIGIPFRPYDLRHSWAVRSVPFYEPVIAAKMLGHSLSTHNLRYHRWLNEKHLKAAFDQSRGSKRP
jgi:integrase